MPNEKQNIIEYGDKMKEYPYNLYWDMFKYIDEYDQYKCVFNPELFTKMNLAMQKTNENGDFRLNDIIHVLLLRYKDKLSYKEIYDLCCKKYKIPILNNVQHEIDGCIKVIKFVIVTNYMDNYKIGYDLIDFFNTNPPSWMLQLYLNIDIRYFTYLDTRVTNALTRSNIKTISDFLYLISKNCKIDIGIDKIPCNLDKYIKIRGLGKKSFINAVLDLHLDTVNILIGKNIELQKHINEKMAKEHDTTLFDEFIETDISKIDIIPELLRERLSDIDVFTVKDFINKFYKQPNIGESGLIDRLGLSVFNHEIYSGFKLYLLYGSKIHHDLKHKDSKLLHSLNTPISSTKFPYNLYADILKVEYSEDIPLLTNCMFLKILDNICRTEYETEFETGLKILEMKYVKLMKTSDIVDELNKNRNEDILFFDDVCWYIEYTLDKLRVIT